MASVTRLRMQMLLDIHIVAYRYLKTSNRNTVPFVPFYLGDHAIEIKYADVPIHGSPFVVKAYDATKVRVTDVNNGVVGKFVFFSSK